MSAAGSGESFSVIKRVAVIEYEKAPSYRRTCPLPSRLRPLPFPRFKQVAWLIRFSATCRAVWCCQGATRGWRSWLWTRFPSRAVTWWPHHILWEWKVLIFGERNVCLLTTAEFKYPLPVWIPALTPLLSLKSIQFINFRTLICNLLQLSRDMSGAWIPPR